MAKRTNSGNGGGNKKWAKYGSWAKGKTYKPYVPVKRKDNTDRSIAQTTRGLINREALKVACTATTEQIFSGCQKGLGGERVQTKNGMDYLYINRGHSILMVAHLDTVIQYVDGDYKYDNKEMCVECHTLDDRLGLYVILDLLPKLGVDCDILLTDGEEMGQSTAEYLPHDKQYNWIAEFDRTGTDVVLYQYDNPALRKRLQEVGFRIGQGSFSDISYLQHMECKAMNIGVGYHEAHTHRCYAYLEDTVSMVLKFVEFYKENKDNYLPHEKQSTRHSWYGGGGSGGVTTVDDGDAYWDAYDSAWSSFKDTSDDLCERCWASTAVCKCNRLCVEYVVLEDGQSPVCYMCNSSDVIKTIGGYWACGIGGAYVSCDECFDDDMTVGSDKFNFTEDKTICCFCETWLPNGKDQRVVSEGDWSGSCCLLCFHEWANYEAPKINTRSYEIHPANEEGDYSVVLYDNDIQRVTLFVNSPERANYHARRWINEEFGADGKYELDEEVS